MQNFVVKFNSMQCNSPFSNSYIEFLDIDGAIEIRIHGALCDDDLLLVEPELLRQQLLHFALGETLVGVGVVFLEERAGDLLAKNFAVFRLLCLFRIRARIRSHDDNFGLRIDRVENL